MAGARALAQSLHRIWQGPARATAKLEFALFATMAFQQRLNTVTGEYEWVSIAVFLVPQSGLYSCKESATHLLGLDAHEVRHWRLAQPCKRATLHLIRQPEQARPRAMLALTRFVHKIIKLPMK